jgi:hypothetical protein
MEASESESEEAAEEDEEEVGWEDADTTDDEAADADPLPRRTTRLGAAAAEAMLYGVPADAHQSCGTRKRVSQLPTHAQTELPGTLGANAAVTPQQSAAKRRHAGRAPRSIAARPCDY